MAAGGRGTGDRGGMQPLFYRRSVGFEVPSSGRECRCFYLPRALETRREKKSGRDTGGRGPRREGRRWSGLFQINSCRDSSQSYLTLIRRSNEFYNVPFGTPARNNYRPHWILVPGMFDSVEDSKTSEDRWKLSKEKDLNILFLFLKNEDERFN